MNSTQLYQLSNKTAVRFIYLRLYLNSAPALSLFSNCEQRNVFFLYYQIKVHKKFPKDKEFPFYKNNLVLNSSSEIWITVRNVYWKKNK